MEPAPPTPTPSELSATEAHRRRTLLGLVSGFIVLLILIVVVQWFSDTPSDEARDSELFETRFDQLGGGTIELAQFEGTPVVLNFFASWCGPCRAELPEFAEVNEAFGDSVQFVGLNADETDVEEMRNLIEVSGVTYPVALGGSRSTIEDLGAVSMPTTVIYNADGTRCKVWPGALSGDDLTDFINACMEEGAA